MRSPRPIQWFLPLALLLAAPTVSWAQLGEVWSTPHSQRYHVYEFADMNGDGALEMLTSEYAGGKDRYFGVRSAATGELLARSVASYEATDIRFVDIDGTGTPEMLFTTLMDGRLICLRYEEATAEVAVYWSIRPLIPTPFILHFADLAADGRPYLLIEDTATPGAFQAYHHRGALFGTYEPDVAQSAMFEALLVGNFDSDPNEEIMVIHREGVDQLLALVDTNTLLGVSDPPTDLRSVQLGASRPNPAMARARIPYSIASRGPVTLRLLDAQGRAVRELVNGEMPAGSHEAIWDGRDASGRAAPAGVYFYELSASGQRVSRRMIRLQAVR